MNEQLEESWQHLKTQRDEIRIQMHLAKAELKDEWEKLDKKWFATLQKYDELREDTQETAHEIHDGFAVVVDELSETYKRIKKRLE
jgi:hypothetical protein